MGEREAKKEYVGGLSGRLTKLKASSCVVDRSARGEREVSGTTVE